MIVTHEGFEFHLPSNLPWSSKVLNTPSSSYSIFASIPPNSLYHLMSFHTKASTLLDLNDLSLLSMLTSSPGIWPVSVPCGAFCMLQDKEKGEKHRICDLFLATQPNEQYSWKFKNLLSGPHCLTVIFWKVLRNELLVQKHP